jgi:futalosine hydrolase
MVATAAHCAQRLAGGRYDLALNLGLCGAFDPALPLGAVVHVVTDRISELGAEDGEGFLTLHELGLDGDGDPAEFRGELVNEAPPVCPALAELPAVRGITVNTVHGNERSIADVLQRFDPQIESMEGAGFMYACLLSQVPFAQVRAVSNRVERRNRAAWRIAEAVAGLERAALAMLDSL